MDTGLHLSVLKDFPYLWLTFQDLQQQKVQTKGQSKASDWISKYQANPQGLLNSYERE